MWNGIWAFYSLFKTTAQERKQREQTPYLSHSVGVVPYGAQLETFTRFKSQADGNLSGCSKKEPLLEPSCVSPNQSKQLWGAHPLGSLYLMKDLNKRWFWKMPGVSLCSTPVRAELANAVSRTAGLVALRRLVPLLQILWGQHYCQGHMATQTILRAPSWSVQYHQCFH